MNFIIPLVVYPYDIMFSVGEADKQFLKACEARMPDDDYKDLLEDSICSLSRETNGRTYHHLVGGWTIIRLPKKPTTPAQYGTLFHEIFHAVYFIFSRIGIRLCEDSDEAFAYLIGYITEQFLSNLKKP